MEKLKYIRNLSSMGEQSKKKLEDMWIIMGGKDFEGVSRTKLRKALLTIEGIYDETKNIGRKPSSKKSIKFESMSWQNLEDLACFRGQFE